MIKTGLCKWMYIFIGVLSVGIGTVGILVPLLPTTPFLLLAAACFIRSSERLYQWLIKHKWFGSYIKNYIEHHAITNRAKIVTILLLWSSLCFTALWVINTLALRVLLLFIGIGVTLHVLSFKTITREMLSEKTKRRTSKVNSQV